MAEIWKRSIEACHEARYMFLGSDERIRKYRHAVFTDKSIECCVLLLPRLSVSVVVHSLYLVWSELSPVETDAVLAVDADTELPFAVANQGC